MLLLNNMEKSFILNKEHVKKWAIKRSLKISSIMSISLTILGLIGHFFLYYFKGILDVEKIKTIPISFIVFTFLMVLFLYFPLVKNCSNYEKIIINDFSIKLKSYTILVIEYSKIKVVKVSKESLIINKFIIPVCMLNREDLDYILDKSKEATIP